MLNAIYNTILNTNVLLLSFYIARGVQLSSGGYEPVSLSAGAEFEVASSGQLTPLEYIDDAFSAIGDSMSDEGARHARGERGSLVVYGGERKLSGGPLLRGSLRSEKFRGRALSKPRKELTCNRVTIKPSAT